MERQQPHDCILQVDKGCCGVQGIQATCISLDLRCLLLLYVVLLWRVLW